MFDKPKPNPGNQAVSQGDAAKAKARIGAAKTGEKQTQMERNRLARDTEYRNSHRFMK